MQLMGDQDFSEDEGMPSLAEMEAGFLGRDLFAARSSKRKTKKKTKTTATEGREEGMEMAFPLPHPPLSRSSLFYGDCSEQPRHFLDACFLCKKPLLQNRDIFMYRGDIPFCSEECRQEQMDKEEATERNRILSLRDAAASSSSSSNSDATRDPLQQEDAIPPTTTNRSRFHDFLRRAAGSILAG